MINEIILRKQAQLFGLVKYFTGKPCPHGHVGFRYTGSGGCWDCMHLGQEDRRSYHKERYEKNPSEKLAARKVHYYKNRESSIEKTKIWQSANPEKTREYKLVNKAYARAEKINRLPPWYGELDDLVMREAIDLTGRRTEITGVVWHVDHMIPLVGKLASGFHCASNLQVIPQRLNQLKSTKMWFTNPGEWVQFA